MQLAARLLHLVWLAAQLTKFFFFALFRLLPKWMLSYAPLSTGQGRGLYTQIAFGRKNQNVGLCL